MRPAWDYAFANGMTPLAKYWIRTTLWMIGFSIVLKVLLGIKLVDFGLVISGWMFFGRIISNDDELPGGFFNPDGELPFPKYELSGIGLSFIALLSLKAWLASG